MPATINTNVNALFAQNASTANSRAMSTAMQQLSTGSRINSAKDDAAGLGISQNMTSQIRGLNQAVRNVNDGISMMQTTEGALVEVSNMLQRMRELAVQSANGTYSPTQRTYLQTEFDALSTQIGRIGTDTKWNDQATLATTATYTYQAGTSNGTTITVTLSGMSQGDLGLTGVNASIGASTTNAVSALTVIDAAIDKVNLNRAKIGSGINQMSYAADNLSNISTNLSASRSSIQDTDYASASTQLSKAQIVQQAATAMLAQANQHSQSVLSLLK